MWLSGEAQPSSLKWLWFNNNNNNNNIVVGFQEMGEKKKYARYTKCLTVYDIYSN